MFTDDEVTDIAKLLEKKISESMKNIDEGNNLVQVVCCYQLRAELAAYVAAHKLKQLIQPLFYTQRSEGFTANTLTHIVNGI